MHSLCGHVVTHWMDNSMIVHLKSGVRKSAVQLTGHYSTTHTSSYITTVQYITEPIHPKALSLQLTVSSVQCIEI